MIAALEAQIAELDGDVLMITGVRQGESAVRDRRIEMSCSRDGAECGQGWYQQVLPQAAGIRGRIATLAPILHWRVCNVRSEEHTSELQSLMRISYAVFCLKKKTQPT